MNSSPKECTELVVFFDLMKMNYAMNESSFPTISNVDIRCFIEILSKYHDGTVECEELIYDSIMEPLVQSSLAHFLYLKKNCMDMNDINSYHPNYVRLKFMDDLVASKSSITLNSFRYYVFSPSTAPIDMNKFMLSIKKLIKNSILNKLVISFVNKLHLDRDTSSLDRILDVVKKKNPARTLGILYYILLDLYLYNLDIIMYDTIRNLGSNCFWARCLNIGILGFANQKTLKENETLQLDLILPAWGLSAHVRSGSKGGKILRPMRGKLYINKEGILHWNRPESIIEI